MVLKGHYNRYASYRWLHVTTGTCVPCFIVKVHVTLTLKRMSQRIVNDFYYKYIYAITRITWYFHKIRRVLISHIKLVKGGYIQFQARGYGNSSVKKVRINKQPGRFLTCRFPMVMNLCWFWFPHNRWGTIFYMFLVTTELV